MPLSRSAAPPWRALAGALALCLSAAAAAADPPPIAGPEQGGPRNWRVADIRGALNLRAAPSTDAAIRARLGAGALLDNLGCQVAAGRTWCDVQPLGGGPRGHVAADYLSPATGPDGIVPTGPDTTALRAGRGEFDATGRLPCAMAGGGPASWCEFGVARSRGGYATVVIDRPGKGRRSVYFRLGRAIGAGTSEADHGAFRAERTDDRHVIRVGDERYEIPEAVVLGG